MYDFLTIFLLIIDTFSLQMFKNQFLTHFLNNYSRFKISVFYSTILLIFQDAIPKK